MPEYEPTVWVNETPQASPVKYRIQDDVMGELAGSAIIEPVTAITPGTPLNAANLNKIEQALQSALANRTRSFLVPAIIGDDNVSGLIHPTRDMSFPSYEMVEDHNVHVDAMFSVPQDFVSSLKIQALIQNQHGIGNIYAKLIGHYGGLGESYNAHTFDTGYLTSAAPPISKIAALIEATLASASPGDVVGVEFYRQGYSALDTVGSVWFLGFLITYTASS